MQAEKLLRAYAHQVDTLLGITRHSYQTARAGGFDDFDIREYLTSEGWHFEEIEGHYVLEPMTSREGAPWFYSPDWSDGGYRWESPKGYVSAKYIDEGDCIASAYESFLISGGTPIDDPEFD